LGGYHTNRAPGLDFLDKLSQATGNAQAPDRESLRYACIWKATIMLFSRYKVAYEKKRKIVRNVASIAEFKKWFFAEIDKVENRDDLEKLSVKYLGREKGILTAVLRSLGGMPLCN
jgi:aminoacyl tRNA synthetase class II-like protein